LISDSSFILQTCEALERKALLRPAPILPKFGPARNVLVDAPMTVKVNWDLEEGDGKTADAGGKDEDGDKK
jgi:hypothetical protein